MATNDFLPFAGGAGANVLSQADYEALAALGPGFGSGILLSEYLNKVLRQATVMAAVLGQWIADKSGNDVLDDGTTATIVTSLTAALASLGLRDASTTQKGVAELATNAETLALSDTGRVVTPSNLAALLASTTQKGILQLADSATIQAGTDNAKAATAASLLAGLLGAGGGGGSDYITIPYRDKTDGTRKNFIIQWGNGATASNGSGAVTFPIAFPNACLCYWANSRGATGVTNNYFSGGTAFSTTGGTFWMNSSGAGQGFNWVVIGN